MKELIEGNVAPMFSGKNQDDKTISLADFKGRKVILYFYPRDNTPGCTDEACNLNENFADLLAKGFDVIGVSPDTTSSHKKFIDKFNLKFNLIADTEKTILQQYGVWGEKNMYGKISMGVLRSTFVIDEKGNIEKIIRKVNTKDHTNQIYTELKLS